MSLLEEAARKGTCLMLQPGQVVAFESVWTFFRGRAKVRSITAAGQVS